VTTSAPPYAGLPSAHLPDRLAALATLADIAQDRSGPGGFSPELHRRHAGRRHRQRQVLSVQRAGRG